MTLERTLPIHPIDVLYGEILPEEQVYVVAGPPAEVDEERLRAEFARIVEERFRRVAYRQRDHLFAGRLLHLVDDIAAPLRVLTVEEFHRLTPDQLRDVGDRHLNFYVVRSDDLLILVFMLGHRLWHGTSGRRFLYAVQDLLYPDKPPGRAPVLTAAQWACYRAFQDELTERFRARDDFAEYRRVTVPADDVRALRRSLDRSFTDAVMLWLARTIHDVSGRERSMEIVQFRMDREAARRPLDDPAFGNEGLLVELWEMLPDGFYVPVDPSQGLWREKMQEFIDFYRRFPAKGAFIAFLRWRIRRDRAAHQGKDQERLVLNNLGRTDRPFFRVMFFDPFNDHDSFGLVFVDSPGDELVLQCAPPRKVLRHLDWEAFERRLVENLRTMRDDPRVETRPRDHAPG